jgi:hypothetical protein
MAMRHTEQATKITGWVVIPLLLAVNPASADPPRVRFDAARLRTGTFIYRGTVDGGSPSLSTSSVARLPDGSYRFTAEIPAFDQSWRTIAARSLAPVATVLEMRTREGRHYTLTLNYSGQKVAGHAMTAAAPGGSGPGSDRSVAARIRPGTVAQRIDWAAVMSTDKRPGESLDFQVYDAKTGFSRVHCQVGDAGMMNTPEGRVHAIRLNYTVYKSTGTEAYAVYTSAAFPRVMLREELRGNLVISLVRIRP